MAIDIGSVLVTACIAGLIGGAGMEFVLWFVGNAGWAKTDMIVALGSLFTQQRERAWRTGAFIHVLAAIAFAVLYTLLMLKLGYTAMPESFALGAGIGFLHGLVVSLGLVWVVAERHPLEEFQEAGLAIGLSHILGHVAYGALVGAVVGIAPF